MKRRRHSSPPQRRCRTSTKFVYLPSRIVIMRCTSPSIFRFSASSTSTYHLLSRVLPCRFCSRKKRICTAHDSKAGRAHGPGTALNVEKRARRACTARRHSTHHCEGSGPPAFHWRQVKHSRQTTRNGLYGQREAAAYLDSAECGLVWGGIFGWRVSFSHKGDRPR